ncbi:hypothetical protein HPB49_025971 [Dermacentor silvarum]|nr:hypothetical protein HPB49_025971 [Dermacentor silvarum]
MLSKTNYNTQAGPQSGTIGYQPAISSPPHSRTTTPSSLPGAVSAAAGQSSVVTLESIHDTMQQMLYQMGELNNKVKENTLSNEDLERRIRKVEFGSRKRVDDENNNTRVKAYRRINNTGDCSDADNCDGGGMNIWQWNCRSFNKKASSLQLFIQNHPYPPDVICLQEVRNQPIKLWGYYVMKHVGSPKRRQFKGDPYVTYVDVAAYPAGVLFAVAAVNGRDNSLTLAASVRADTPAAAETIAAALGIEQHDRDYVATRMFSTGISPPPPFIDTPGTPAVPWPRWIRLFETFLLAYGASKLSAPRRRARLLHYLGTEGQRIADALPPKNAGYDNSERHSDNDSHKKHLKNVNLGNSTCEKAIGIEPRATRLKTSQSPCCCHGHGKR